MCWRNMLHRDIMGMECFGGDWDMQGINAREDAEGGTVWTKAGIAPF